MNVRAWLDRAPGADGPARRSRSRASLLLAAAGTFSVALPLAAAQGVLGNVSTQATTTASTAPCPPPPPPTALTFVSATQTSVTLSWGASPGASGYDLYRDGVRVAGTTQTGATWSGLDCGSTYR